MTRLYVEQVEGLWRWSCRQCQAGEYRNTWRDAIIDAYAHIPVHALFGFGRPR